MVSYSLLTLLDQSIFHSGNQLFHKRTLYDDELNGYNLWDKSVTFFVNSLVEVITNQPDLERLTIR